MSNHYQSALRSSWGFFYEQLEAAVEYHTPGRARYLSIVSKECGDRITEMLCWAIYGQWKQTFAIGPNLLAALGELPLDNIPLQGEDFIAPYPAVYFEFTDSDRELRTPWGPTPVAGVYIVFWDELRKHYERDKERDMPTFMVPANTGRVSFSFVSSDQRFDPAEGHTDLFSLSMPVTGSFDEVFAERFGINLDDAPSQQALDEINTLKSQLRSILHAVVNTVAYVGTYNAELKEEHPGADPDVLEHYQTRLAGAPAKKKDKWAAKLARENSKCVVTRIAPTLEAKLQVEYDAREHTHLQRRTLVRAHRQRYWYGVNGQQVRRWKLKCYYVKGEGADATRTAYSVE